MIQSDKPVASRIERKKKLAPSADEKGRMPITDRTEQDEGTGFVIRPG